MAEKIVKDSQCLVNDLANDCISRQAAVAGFYEMASDMDYLCTVSDYVSFLESLPSAQPVITCDGCKFVGTYDTDFPCRNCIRREKDYYAQE